MLNCRIRRRRRPSALPHDKQFQKRGERGRGHDRGRRGRLRNKRNRPVRHRDPARDPALVESIPKVSTTTYVKPCRGVLSDFSGDRHQCGGAAQNTPPPCFSICLSWGRAEGRRRRLIPSETGACSVCCPTPCQVFCVESPCRGFFLILCRCFRATELRLTAQTR